MVSLISLNVPAPEIPGCVCLQGINSDKYLRRLNLKYLELLLRD